MDLDEGIIKPTIISAVIIMNIIVNTLVIAVIAKFPDLREDRTTLFMFSLSVSDIAAGCISMPISAAVCSSATPTVRHMTRYLPEVQLFFMGCFAFNSLHSLCWMTVCKMVALLKPLRYEQLLTFKRCYGIVVFNWVFGAAVAAAKFNMGASWNMLSCTYALPESSAISVLSILVNGVTVFIPGVVLVYATVRIVVVVVRTHRAISAQVHDIEGGAGNAALVTLKAIRSAKNVLIICFVSVLLMLPVLTAASLYRLTTDRRLAATFGFIAMWLFNCNSFMNSFLYLVLFRTVRNKTKRLLTAVYQCLLGN